MQKRRTLILDQQAQVLKVAKVEQPVPGVLQGLAAPQVLEEPGVLEELAVLLLRQLHNEEMEATHMNNNQRLSVVVAIAASLLAVGIVTAFSMVEQAEAAKKNKVTNTNTDSTSAIANGADGTSGTSGADGTDGADGGTAVATITQ
jgi:hypothetical protein